MTTACLKKGDTVLVVYCAKLAAGRVKRIWPSTGRVRVEVQQGTYQPAEYDFEMNPTKDGYYQACFNRFDRPKWRGFAVEDEDKAKELLSAQQLDSRRYELERWIYQAPLEIVAEVAAIKDRQTDSKEGGVNDENNNLSALK